MYSPLALLGLVGTAMATAIGERATLLRCGSEHPPADILAQAAAMNANHAPVPLAGQTINIKTYFHVVTTSAAQGSVTQTQLNNQVCPPSPTYAPFASHFSDHY